jgi:virginiamycin B lyase
MEITNTFSQCTSLGLIRCFEHRRALREGCSPRPARRQPERTRTRARFRLEGLERRCLLSGISSISEFSLPSGSGLSPFSQGITTGPDGNLWFTERGANAIGTINPTTHAISSFTVPTANASPAGITVCPDGNLWFTEYGANKIGFINPSTHAISEFAVPATLAEPDAITAGADGNLWFTDIGIGVNPKQIGEINPTSHAISAFPTSTPATLRGITAGPDGNLWFAIQADEVGRINPTTHAISYFPTQLGSYGITAGPDGNIWLAQDGPNSGMIGEINPSTYATSEFSLSGAPWGMAAGPDGNVWFADEDGRMGQINVTTNAITEYSIPYTGTSPVAITTGPDGNLWFTDPGTNAIGVATLTASQLVVTAEPPPSVTAGAGFGLTVTAEDGSGNPITSFDGTVTVALATNPAGAALGGTLSVTASYGVATFSGLTITTAASGYTLEASASGLGSGVTSSITVTPAAASQLVITTEPPATVKLNGAFGLQASVEDAYGNVVTTASNSVSVAFANNPTGATLGGTLSVAASQGVATFSNLTINKVGNGYTLAVSSSGLSGATSTAINVTKKGQSIVGSPPASSSAVDPVLGPLVLDSPDLWDGVGLKKRASTM